jgi:hypothetical protein
MTRTRPIVDLIGIVVAVGAYLVLATRGDIVGWVLR